MPPKAKAKRAASPGPKAKAAAKAKAVPEPTREEVIAKEGLEQWEKYEEEGVMKLKTFAECVRAMNIKKCMIYGDEPGAIVGEQWKLSGGKTKREVNKEEFVAWWPQFVEATEKACVERDALEKKQEDEKAAKATAKASRFEGDGMWTIPLEELTDAINAAYAKGKTPLIVDNTEGFRSEVFFTYSGAYILECKKMIMDKAKGKENPNIVEEVLEAERTRFWSGNCFKHGQTVVFRMANSACDIKGTFNSEVFPSLKLLDASEVNKVLGPDQADNFKGSPFMAMCMTDDQRTEHTCMGVNEKFRVVVITQFKEEDYKEYLDAMFPLDLCQPIKPTTKE